MLKLTMESIRQIMLDNLTFKTELAAKPTYIDYGSGWMEIQMIASSPSEFGNGYQVFNPKEVVAIKEGKFEIDDLKIVIEKMNKRGW